jgi:hypothetical protein
MYVSHEIELNTMWVMECLFLIIICDEPHHPDGTPLKWISVYKQIVKNRTAPPCLGEARRRRSPHEITWFNDFQVRV